MDGEIPYGRMVDEGQELGVQPQVQQVQPQVQQIQQVQPQVQPIQQAQPTILVANPTQPRMEKFNSRAALGLGIVQIVCGALAIIIAIVLIATGSILSPVADGIWCGIIIILAGTFQIVAGRNKSRCWIITSLVFCILAAVFTIPILVTGSGDIANERDRQRWYNYQLDQYYYHWRNWNAYYALRGCHLFVALVEGVVAIISSVLACRPLCCNNSAQGSAVSQTVQYVSTGHPGQQVIMMAPVQMNQQMVPHQQVMMAPMTVQPAFTAPVLTTTGVPPVYTTIQAAPTVAPVQPMAQAVPIHATQITPPEQKMVPQ